MSKDRGPRIFFPPPIIYVLGFTASLALDHYLPLGISIQSTLTEIIGSVVIMLGLLLIALGMGIFAKRKTGIVPIRPASELVIQGIYHYTRNPMYLGMLLLYLGGVLVLDSAWAVPLLIPMLLIIRYYVIAREERYLSQLFGAAYVQYCQTVRRWV